MRRIGACKPEAAQGKTWDQLRKTPAQLMKLVVEDKAVVVGKDKYGRLLYRLKSPA